MMKKILCLLCALALCAVIPAAAENAAEPVTAAELDALAKLVRTNALDGQPLNDPAGEDAVTEDGTCFRYEVARIYAYGTELTEETPVNALVFEDSEGPVFRGTGIDTQVKDLLAAFPLANAELGGTREEAVLYLEKTADGGFVYGRILRDGQRLSAAEYGEVIPSGDSFRRAAVTYTLRDGLVTAIRAEGLNPAELTDAIQAQELYAELEELSGMDAYRAVKTSLNGLELTAFCEADLVFDGFSYTALQPATLPGSPETEMIEDDDGTWLMRCDGDGYEAVFRCDAQGENAVILSFTLLDDGTEGPRCVRIGDWFHEDYQRFRSGENDMGEDMTELLYGTEDTAPRGMACYDTASGEMSLQYVAALSDGTEVELLLKYEDNRLSEIIIRTVS